MQGDTQLWMAKWSVPSGRYRLQINQLISSRLSQVKTHLSWIQQLLKTDERSVTSFPRYLGTPGVKSEGILSGVLSFPARCLRGRLHRLRFFLASASSHCRTQSLQRTMLRLTAVVFPVKVCHHFCHLGFLPQSNDPKENRWKVKQEVCRGFFCVYFHFTVYGNKSAAWRGSYWYCEWSSAPHSCSDCRAGARGLELWHQHFHKKISFDIYTNSAGWRFQKSPPWGAISEIVAYQTVQIQFTENTCFV